MFPHLFSPISAWGNTCPLPAPHGSHPGPKLAKGLKHPVSILGPDNQGWKEEGPISSAAQVKKSWGTS